MHYEYDHGSSKTVTVLQYFWQQASTAKYIVQQYIAATGGQATLNAVHNMCVTGEVKIKASEFHEGEQTINVKGSE